MANPNPSPATRFKPGRSGNPAGRPKGRTLGARLCELLEATSFPGVEIPEGKTLGVSRILDARRLDLTCAVPGTCRLTINRSRCGAGESSGPVDVPSWQRLVEDFHRGLG